MTAWDEEKTPVHPHAIPHRAPVVMPSLAGPSAATAGQPPPRGTTPRGLGPQSGTLYPLGTSIPALKQPTVAPGACLGSTHIAGNPRKPPPLPPRPPSTEGLPSIQRLLRTWDRLTPENRRLVESLALALLPPAVDASRR